MPAWLQAFGPLILQASSVNIYLLRVEGPPSAAKTTRCTVASKPHLLPFLNDVINEVFVDDANLLLRLSFLLVPPVLVVKSYVWVSSL